MTVRHMPGPAFTRRILLLLAAMAVLISGCDRLPQSPSGTLHSKTTDKAFAEVLEDLEFAITERNYRIVNTLEIGKAIRERGVEDFPDNSIILFCNLSLARSMLELEPDYLDRCPMRISIRQTPDHVLIHGHLFPETGYNQALDQILRKGNSDIVEIIDYASREWFEEQGDL